MAERPAFAVEKAVKGMLPKNRLGRAMSKKLHVVAGPDHPHQAQQPVALAFGERPRWEGLPQPTPLKPRHVKAPRQAEADEPTAAVPAERPTPKRTTSAAKKATAKKATTKKPTAKKPTARAAKPSAAKTATTRKTTAKASAAKRTTTTRRAKQASKDEEA
jgi:hypothetical protein